MAEGRRFNQLVVIGSSAGGIEALSHVVAGLPEDFAAPIVIAQHLDRGRPSHLRDILARRTPLPVLIVETSEALEPGVIYVVPANRNVEITDHHVEVIEDSSPGSRPSVDRLLSTAARAFGENLIAVILTGSGSDGAAGARAVKAAGGAVVIQDPHTASFPSMPASLAPTTVDVVASMDAIGPLLADLASGAYARVKPDDETILDELLDELRTQSGIDFSTYKKPTILRRLHRRMAARSKTTIREYLSLLHSDPDEYQRLVSTFLIKVTEFFRDEALFTLLRGQILPRLVDDARREGRRELRLWSAGCATGEEAYSLAMAVAEVLGDELQEWVVRIFATDLDNDAILFARRGIYPASTLETAPPDFVQRYFTKIDGGYLVNKPIRVLTVFGQHDLAQRAPFPRTDLILCRNVLIYFTSTLQRRALQLFAFSLREGGYLALGKAETATQLPGPFVLEDPRLKLYRRHGPRFALPGKIEPVVALPAALPPGMPPTPVRIARPRSARRDEGSDELIQRLPIGVVEIDTNYDIRAINARARALLGIRGIAMGRDIIHLARDLPAQQFRAGIDQALARVPWSATFLVPSENPEDERRASLRIDARPLADSGTDGGVVLLIEDISGTASSARAAEDERAAAQTAAQSDAAQSGRLADAHRHLLADNEELALSNTSLRAENQDLIVANEESQSATEEVETLNEELQATNEELETLNEELQATVEELNTTNDDMEARARELREVALALELQQQLANSERARLGAVLSAMRDAVVVIDADGKTVLENDAYTRLIEHGEPVPEDDHGQPLPQEDGLRKRAARGDTFTAQFRGLDPLGARRWYEVVGQPIESGGIIRGGVLVIRDITERSLRRMQNEFVAVVTHELRTPLTALRGYLQLVARNLTADGPPSLARYSGLALEQAERLQDLIGDLLDTARLDAGKLSFQYVEVELGSVVLEAVDIAATLSDRHRVEITTADESLRIRADPGRLQQVILNILSNAMTHARDSERIDVAVTREAGYGVVIVADHGPGIPREELPHLFTRYRQAATPGRGGLGLGLFISREIITAHDGDIAASETPGGGTTITIRVPLEATDWRRPTPPGAAQAASGPDAASPGSDILAQTHAAAVDPAGRDGESGPAAARDGQRNPRKPRAEPAG